MTHGVGTVVGMRLMHKAHHEQRTITKFKKQRIVESGLEAILLRPYGHLLLYTNVGTRQLRCDM